MSKVREATRRVRDFESGVALGRIILLILPLCLFLCGRAVSAEPTAEMDFEESKDNKAIDSFLRKASPLYAAMARIVELRGGYVFEDKDCLEAGCWNAAGRTIEIGSRFKGAKRATLITFEMTNAYQSSLHREVDMAVSRGTITTESEFALRHELVEYDGLRLHRKVLEEIEESLGKLPGEFFFFYNDKRPGCVSEYRLPLVVDYVRQMEASGHSAFYRQWFHRQKRRVAP